jgi:hypothetical protein
MLLTIYSVYLFYQTQVSRVFSRALTRAQDAFLFDKKGHFGGKCVWFKAQCVRDAEVVDCLASTLLGDEENTFLVLFIVKKWNGIHIPFESRGAASSLKSGLKKW